MWAGLTDLIEFDEILIKINSFLAELVSLYESKIEIITNYQHYSELDE